MFVPVVFLTGAAKYLFTPLAMAVVFAMMASYFLSRTLVPTMVHYLLAPRPRSYSHGEHEATPQDDPNFQHPVRAGCAIVLGVVVVLCALPMIGYFALPQSAAQWFCPSICRIAVSDSAVWLAHHALDMLIAAVAAGHRRDHVPRDREAPPDLAHARRVQQAVREGARRVCVRPAAWSLAHRRAVTIIFLVFCG